MSGILWLILATSSGAEDVDCNRYAEVREKAVSGQQLTETELTIFENCTEIPDLPVYTGKPGDPFVSGAPAATASGGILFDFGAGKITSPLR
ncbi:MAG: hypothetical protein ACWA5A_08070 [Marinibacterium sp.]